jgi:hypothetical protein
LAPICHEFDHRRFGFSWKFARTFTSSAITSATLPTLVCRPHTRLVALAQKESDSTLISRKHEILDSRQAR